MVTWFQYRDPLVGVLDYIAEVRLPGHNCFALIVLSVPQKNCQTDNVEEGILAIAHHDDLQYVDDDVVCSSQNAGIYTRVMSSSRKPRPRMQYRSFYMENKCPCSLRMAVCPLLFQGL